MKGIFLWCKIGYYCFRVVVHEYHACTDLLCPQWCTKRSGGHGETYVMSEVCDCVSAAESYHLEGLRSCIHVDTYLAVECALI